MNQPAGKQPMDRIKQLLFGSVESIEIHSLDPHSGDRLRNGVVASLGALGRKIPVNIKRASLDVEFVMVRYGSGLLRPAHADVTVLN
jgi:hypothetical protein